jgi:hypothetical protein
VSTHFSHEVPYVDDGAGLPEYDVAEGRYRLLDATPDTAIHRYDLLAEKIELSGFEDYLQSNKTEIREMEAKFKLPDWPEIETKEPPNMVIGVPIEVANADPYAIVPTFASIRTAAEQLDRRVLVVAWPNWDVPHARREPDQLRKREKVAKLCAEAALETLDPQHSNVHVLVGYDPMITEQYIAMVRHRMSLAIAGVLKPWLNTLRQGVKALHDIPYMQLDDDTVIAPSSLKQAALTIHRDRALFVNGTLHYVGPLMEKTLAELQNTPQDQRLLYVTEKLRRDMLDHLPPEASRGYLPEAGLTMKLGALLTLGIETKTNNDESYWLRRHAQLALDNNYDVSRFVTVGLPRTSYMHPPQPSAGAPFLSPLLARKLERFIRYEDYLVETSISGISRMIEHHGVQGAIDFDQGPQYALRSQPEMLGPHSEPWQELSHAGAVQYLNMMYSYFADCGGKLLAEHLSYYDSLLDVIAHREDASLYSWRPTYIPPNERLGRRLDRGKPKD